MWKKYRKPATQEMRDYIIGEDLTGISIAPGETPKEGGKIARDAQGSLWYVSPEFMAGNYVLAEDDTKSEMEDCRKFVRHIQDHLLPGEVVMCKICNKSIHEIAISTE